MARQRLLLVVITSLENEVISTSLAQSQNGARQQLATYALANWARTGPNTKIPASVGKINDTFFGARGNGSAITERCYTVTPVPLIDDDTASTAYEQARTRTTKAVDRLARAAMQGAGAA